MENVWTINLFTIADNVNGEPKCEPIRICYFNRLWKCYRKICDYNNALKRINDIFKRTKV